MAAVRQIVLGAMNSSRAAALSGGSIVAADELFAALTSRGLLPVCCAAAAPGGPAVSAASGLLPVLSASTDLLPKFFDASGLTSAISPSRAARSVAGSGGPCFGSRISVESFRSGTLIVVGLAGATVCSDLLDSYLMSEGDDASNGKKLQTGSKDDEDPSAQDKKVLPRREEEVLPRREGRLLELIERHLDELKTCREDLARREKNFDKEAAKKQEILDEERKLVDNGKKLLDDDRRKFHQERYQFGGGKNDKKEDGKIIVFMKRLEDFLGIPGRIIGLKKKAEDFEKIHQGLVMFCSAYGSLILAGKFGEIFRKGRRSVQEGAFGSPGELPTFCPRCGLELPKLKACSPCAADGRVAKAPAGVAPPS